MLLMILLLLNQCLKAEIKTNYCQEIYTKKLAVMVYTAV